MDILDFVLGFVILGVTVLQTFRGFGRAVFDGLGLYCALWIASTSTPFLSGAMHLTSDSALNQAIWFALLFVGLGTLALLLSRFVYGSILLNLGMFDHFLGLIAGFACALIVAHGIVQTMSLGSAGSSGPSIVASSNVGSECMNFGSYHTFVNTLYSVTGGHDEQLN